MNAQVLFTELCGETVWKIARVGSWAYFWPRHGGKRPLCPSSGLIEEPLWRLSGIFQTVSEGNTSEVRGLSSFSKLRSASTTNNKDVRCGTEQTGLRIYSPNGL